MFRLLVSILIPTSALLLFDAAATAQTRKTWETPPADMTLHVVPQSHIDIAWWWRYDPQTVHVVAKRTLEMAFANMEAFPDYTFTFLQVPAIQPLETLAPDLFYKIHYYLFHSTALGPSIPNPHGVDPEKGRFKVASGLWLELDPCVPSGESLVRQCLYGKRYYKYKFGLDIKSAWFQDAWTHPWTYPQILKKAGIDTYMFGRGEAPNRERMFWWESPDGSRVFVYQPAIRGGALTRERVEPEMAEVARRYGVRDHIAMVGVGNHGGGANSKDVADWRKTMGEMPAKARFSTHTQFLSSVLSKPHEFPVVKTELSPTIRGAYTTLGEMKKLHRDSENLLLTTEKFSAIAAQLGVARYPQESLYNAWVKMMMNQSHDAISGTTIPPATDDAFKLFREVLESANKELRNALGAIAARIDTSGQGTPVVLFNPLSWERTELAEVTLDLPEPADAVEVTDPQGKPVASQVVHREAGNGKARVTAVFVAEGVPSLGYKVYHAAAAKARSYSSPLRISNQELENEFFRVTVDPATGCLKSIYDKQNKREALASGAKGNLLQVIEDKGDSEGFLRSPEGKIETEHRWTGKSWNLDTDPKIRVLENGPVRVVLEIKKKWELARFTQRISLYPKVARVDFDIDMDWRGQKKMVKVVFPVAVNSPEATYEIQYGNIRRPSRGEEHTAQKWVDVSDQGYGVSLLNAGRNGFDVKDNVIRMSLLRSPTEPAFNTDEIGVHSLRYALYPHKGPWQDAGVVHRGYELNNPLLVQAASSHPGDLPRSHSFVTVEPRNLIVEALKRAEDSEQQYIVRLYESEGRKSSMTLTWSNPMEAVHRTDLLENSTEDLATDGKSVKSAVGAYSIESLKLIHDVRPYRK